MSTGPKERLSMSEKNKSNKQWYKDKADIFENNYSTFYNEDSTGVSEIKRMQVNYDLFNNIVNLKDFEYVCKPYGSKQVGELPATLSNKDISSGPIKSMLGMELKRNFSFNLVATNPEATSQREQEEFGQLKDYVVNQAILPIRQQIEAEKRQENLGRELTQDELRQVNQEIEQELQSRTPEYVKRYMKRQYQDPAELQGTHLIKYLIQKCDVERKLNLVFKHGMLTAKEMCYVGIFNGEPDIWVVNPKRFDCDPAKDIPFVEDREWATYRHNMTPSKIISLFRSELSDSDIDQIYNSWNAHYKGDLDGDMFARFEREKDFDGDSYGIEVVHTTWKSPRKICYLTYMDFETGEEQMMLVDETYKLNKKAGDISIEYDWLPETYETWKIKTATPIYVRMQPLPGQNKDLDNLGIAKLPYYGLYIDDTNSKPTSLMDRLKVWQYYYNIVMYRLELLIASDKGKKVLMNMKYIPKKYGIDLKKWQYFFDATPFMYFDNSEEEANYVDANSVGKVIDLSLVSDIQKYIEIAEYLRKQAGQSVGLPDQVIGQIGPREAVGNTQQTLIQSSHILEMYFELHSYLKKNVITALYETAKIAYADSKPRKLSYFLDDMSIQLFDLDIGKLEGSTLGLFVENSLKIEEAKDSIKMLAQAALQNGNAALSDIIAMLRSDSIVEYQERLEVAEDNKREQESQAQQQELQAQADEAEKEREFKRETWAEEEKQIVLKEEERRKTVIASAALTGASFNPDYDTDRDGVNDFLEIAKHGLNADIERSKIDLKRQELKDKKDNEKAKRENEKDKIRNEKAKILKGNTKK